MDRYDQVQHQGLCRAVGEEAHHVKQLAALSFVCHETFTTDRDPLLLVAVRGTALVILTRNIGPLLIMIF